MPEESSPQTAVPSRPSQVAATWWEPATLFYLGTALITLVLLARAFTHPWSVSNDYRANCFWMGQLHHPELFRGDLLASYWRDFVSSGVTALYALFTNFISPILFSKLLGFALVLAYLAASWYLGKVLFAERAARWFFAAWMCGNGVLLRSMLGGFSRGFAPALQIAFLSALLTGNPWAALACVAAALFMHPLTFLVLGGTFAGWWLWLLVRRPDGHSLKRHLALGVVALGLAGFGVASLSAHAAEEVTRFGPSLTPRQVLAESPEWAPGGRLYSQRPKGLLADGWDQAVRRIRDRVGRSKGDDDEGSGGPFAVLFWLFAGLVTAGSVGGVIVGHRSGRPVPALLGWYTLITLGAYLVAEWRVPQYYFPERYIQVSIPVLIGALLALTAGRLWRSPGRLGRVAVAGLAGFAFAGGLAFTPPSEHGRDLKPYRPAADWLREHLPTDGMFAAFPSNDGDNLLTLTERPCLITYECDLALHSGFQAETRRRLELLFNAYYAYTRADVEHLASETPCRYLVVNREDVTRRLEEGKPRDYPQPYRRQIRQRVSAHSGQSSFWTAPGAPQPVYMDEEYFIFDLAPFAFGGGGTNPALR